VTQAIPAGPVTLRHDFGGRVVYGKLYRDGRGRRSYEALQALWNNGFGAAHRERVPEPLAFDHDRKLLLAWAAPGVSLARLLRHGPREDRLRAVRQAARWLARLHACSLPGLRAEPPCERVGVFGLADMLAQAAAAHPEECAALLELLQRLRAPAAAGADATLVPTHGRYVPASVHVLGEEVTVTDLDHLCLSDPAKDVARFVHRARALVFDGSADPADADDVEAAFVTEYCARAGLRPRNLSYYSALYALRALARCARDRAAGGPLPVPREERHRRRLERCLAESDLPDADAATHRAIREGRAPRRLAQPESDFDVALVQSSLPRASSEGRECQAALVQDTGTGRMTVRYEMGDAVLFGKTYSDGLGGHSHRVLKALWEDGFGPASRHRVPEPIAFWPERNFLVMRAAGGGPLSALMSGDPVRWLEGVRGAARWLAALHRSPVRVGEPEPEWDSLKAFRLTVRLLKAAAARPREGAILRERLQVVKDRLKRLPAGRPVVQTHGRYHHDHVFIGPEAVAVIDLDRSRPADPAKDAAEFVRVLRWTAFKSGLAASRAEAATAAFLDEYLSRVPEAHAGLPYYWSSYLLLGYLGALKKPDVADDRTSAVVGFYSRELERVMELAP
jgi:aminoglycoside phosphotransferase (APT) family kinase protein